MKYYLTVHRLWYKNKHGGRFLSMISPDKNICMPDLIPYYVEHPPQPGGMFLQVAIRKSV